MENDYMIRSGIVVALILVHLFLLIFKPLLAIFIIFIYIVVLGSDLFVTLQKFKKGVELEIKDATIVQQEDILVVSFDMKGPTGGFIPKNYSLDLGIYDGEDLVAEFTHLAPAGKVTTVELEAEMFVEEDLAGKTLTIAGETIPMILFIPIPYNKFPENSLVYADITFPDQDIVMAGEVAAEVEAE